MPEPGLIMATRSRSHSTLRQRSMERCNKLTKSMSAAASRNTSPSPSTSASATTANRRVARLNLYLQKSAKSTDKLQRGTDASSLSPRSTFIKRWDGNQRMTSKWDSLRRVSRHTTRRRSIHRLTAYRIPSFGFLMGTVWFTSTNEASPDAGLL